MEKSHLKPVHDIDALCELLSPCAVRVTDARKIQCSSASSFFLLMSGNIKIQEKSGVILPVTAPMVLGLAGICGIHKHITLYDTGNNDALVLMEVSTRSAQSVIENAGRWKQVATVISYNMSAYNHYFSMLVYNDTYNTIRESIILVDEMQKKGGGKMLVAKFIVESTGLSRSSVMKTLSNLKKGGYINIENGFLTGVSTLPMRY